MYINYTSTKLIAKRKGKGREGRAGQEKGGKRKGIGKWKGKGKGKGKRKGKESLCVIQRGETLSGRHRESMGNGLSRVGDRMRFVLYDHSREAQETGFSCPALRLSEGDMAGPVAHMTHRPSVMSPALCHLNRVKGLTVILSG